MKGTIKTGEEPNKTKQGTCLTAHHQCHNNKNQTQKYVAKQEPRRDPKSDRKKPDTHAARVQTRNTRPSIRSQKA